MSARGECDSDGTSLGRGKANICLLCVFGPLLAGNVSAEHFQTWLFLMSPLFLLSSRLGSVITLKQKERGLGTIDLRTAQRLLFETERKCSLPHVHQHLALRGRPCELAV